MREWKQAGTNPRDVASTEATRLRRAGLNAVSRAVLRAKLEGLEPRAMLAAAPVLTEFSASNSNGIVDGNGVHSDWIEIQNQGDAAIDLAGWHLTDDATKPAKWTFPSYTLNAGAFMVVFADSTGTPDPAGNLHTSFSLSADGENLSLRKPDGTVVSQFGENGAAYPKQFADISYGTSKILTPTSLIEKGAPAKAFVPVNSSLDAGQWTLPGYVDSTWKSGTTGVGYDGGGTASVTDLMARWYAPSLGLTDNASVSSWGVSTGTGTAVGAGTSRPTYQSDTASRINGKAVVRFDGVNDQLRITNQSLDGLANFSVAMVFRTSTPGRPGGNWYDNTGIVDAEVGGVTDDWGLALNNSGAIGAGVGNPDTTLYSGGGLANGSAHVVVFTKSGTTTALSIDGGAPIYGTANASARTVDQFVFGSLNTNINYFAGDLGEVRLYKAALNEDAVRSLGNTIGSDWGIAPAAGAYTPQIGLDVQASMANLASTANIRVPFTVANPSQFDTLTLNMKYDDGFVAYLNGTEIARRNAPGGAITYTSTALAARADSAALTAESIDVSAFVGLLQGNGATNVLAIKALNVSASDSDLLIVPELVASSSTIGSAYMKTPTPGAANQPGFAGLVDSVSASVSHGYFTSTVTTTLTTATPGATIVYTTDGSVPTLANGTKIAPPTSGATTATLSISSTTVVRAAAFRSGYLASAVTSESYFFISDILQQPEYTPAGAYWDVGMDATVVNNTTQKYSVAQALAAIPTISMSLDAADMFGSASGIYTHPLEEGDAWERAASIEYFDPNNAANQFSINAGVRISGSVSRDPSRPKKGFKLFFRGEYGESKLDFPIFGSTNPQTVFDHLILRAGHNHSWANLGGTNLSTGEYMRDQFARDTQKALTGKSSAGDWVQLYINGQYWGLYNTAEDIDPDWAVANYGGNDTDYDIVKPNDAGGVEADDGNLTAWDQLFGDADAAYADGTVDNAEYANLASQVDAKALADYMISIFYRGDKDGPVLIGSTTSPRNFIALHNRVDPNGKFIFQTQDGELSLDETNFDRTEVYGDQNPGRLFHQLRTNGEFRSLVADEVQRLFTGNGALTVAQNQARYQAIMASIDAAIVGESARWGNAKQATVATRDRDWVGETNWIVNTYMPARTNVVLNQLKADFPELNVIAPTVSVNGVASTGGTIAPGSTVSLADANSPTGTIYYTTDGTDPRATGGTVAPTATTYTAAFTLSRATTVQARVLKAGVWSPVQSVTFNVAPPSLRLSELMYHPPTAAAGSPYAKDEFEFIELTNTGTTPIDLGGMQLLAGVFGTIAAGTTLAPGARGVLVKNEAAFRFGYGAGAQILGTYTDALSNGGEQLRLYDPNSGTDVFNFTYVDSWFPTTDGNGFALVVKDLGPSQAATTVLGAASAWRASVTVGGSPGLAEAVAAVAGRNVYYNNSYFDGANAAMNAADDAAIATDKVALRPGQTATFANYTSYSKGLNGVMVDVAGLNQEQVWALTAADFTFRVGNTSTPTTWTAAPAGATISVRRGAGANGSDRVSITWPDGAIAGRWLEVTLAANARTGLAAPDVFYFGNAIGESGDSTADAFVTAVDQGRARDNPRTGRNPAAIDNLFDFNRDRFVDAADQAIARDHVTTGRNGLLLITIPGSSPAGLRAATVAASPTRQGVGAESIGALIKTKDDDGRTPSRIADSVLN